MASNTMLTATKVTREALRILHEQLSFTNTTKIDYDNSYRSDGAKRGDTLKIRLPNRYTVRTGAAMSTQDTAEESVDLVTSTQKGVDMEFSSTELTLDLDDFSERILKPAMSVLASDIENDYLQTVTQAVHNQVGTAGTTPTTLLPYLQARARMNQELAPKDNQRCLQLPSNASAVIVNALNGLFHDSTQISKQYREGLMGRSSGFDWYENERSWTYTAGADVAGAVNQADVASGDTQVTVDGFTAALPVGTVITFAAVFAVHPETKATMSHLKNFVVTAATTTTVTVSPAIISTGAKQNVSALPADNAAVASVGSPTASTGYEVSLAYHRDAFAFTTADLVMPEGVDFAAR
ncbi:MAG: P22 phage major capsid protein family protein, partial [Mycobacterium sp.]